MRAVDRHQGVTTRGVGPLLGSTAISVTGDGAFIAAAPLLAASLTRDPLAISVVTAAFYLPWLLVGLAAGALVDRRARRPVLVMADLVRAVILAALAASVLTGAATLPLLVTAVLLVGVAQCFFDSAAQAVIPAIVGRDKEMLTRTNGRYWALDTVGRLLAGPPLGSAAFAVNKALPFIGDALTFLASAVLVSRLPRVPAPEGSHSPVPAIRACQHLLVAPDDGRRRCRSRLAGCAANAPVVVPPGPSRRPCRSGDRLGRRGLCSQLDHGRRSLGDPRRGLGAGECGSWVCPPGADAR